ncbi:MAG: OmpH family outer membrane protein [Mucinivorans sp.]
MKTIKFFAIAALMFVATTSYAQQKFGYVSAQEIISLMPERDSASVKLEAYSKDLQEMYVAMRTEIENKSQDYQKKSTTLSEVMRQQKEKEINQLTQSYQEFGQKAQQDMSNKEQELMAPIIKKFQEAVAKVGKAQGIVMVLDKASMLFVNEALAIDLTAPIKAELGLK